MLNSYLRDLLVLHDCVILPDFGGFVGDYKAAQRVDEHYFTPPSKVVAFNPQLKQNDGLFANTIVAIENSSYDEAMGQIETFVAHIKKELKAKGNYNIAEVGQLQTDEQGRILFTPDATSNLLLSHVGMTAISATPQVKLEPVVVQKSEDNKVVLFPVFRKILVAGVSAVALFSLLLNPGKFEHLSLSSIAPTPESIVVEEPETTVTTPMEVEEAEPVAVPEVVVEKNYHVIVGCFSMEENAKVQQDKLQQDNISSDIFAYNSQLTAVSAGSFESFAKAKVVMDDLRNSGKAPMAWVLKRKILH